MFAKPQSGSRVPRRRRPWWHWPARLAAVLAVGAVLAYATLPWWTPKRWLARRIAGALSGQLQRTVTVGRLDLSWAEGVRIVDLRIADDPAFGGGDMVSVGQLRFELAPLKMLLGGSDGQAQLSWAELTNVRVRLVIDQNGQANLAPLQRLAAGPPPSRLVVRRAAVTVQLPRQDGRLLLNVSDLQYRAGRLSRVGRITMSAALAQDGADAPVTLIASTGRPSPVATCSFRFSGVDLAQLGLPALLRLPLKHLKGRGSGQLDCRVDSEGVVDGLEFVLRVDDLDA
ncbi:hypothetical protein LCGC14_2506620, partial [marine sediment metagenome]